MGRGRPSWWEQVEAREEGKQDQKKKVESKAEQQMESQGRRRLLLRTLVSTRPVCGEGLPESRGQAAAPPPAWLAPHLLTQFGETWAVSPSKVMLGKAPSMVLKGLHNSNCCPRQGRRRGLDSTATTVAQQDCMVEGLLCTRPCAWVSGKQILCHSQVCAGPEP